MKEFLFPDDNWNLYEYLYGENPVRCFFEETLRFNPNSIANYPYYRLRGKPVTPEQAMEIIIRTDNLWFDFDYNKPFDEYVPSTLIENRYYDHGSSDRTGWVHPDGTIGQNTRFGKGYPYIEEIFESLVPLAGSFPYLDFFVGVSWYGDVSNRENFDDEDWENFQKKGFYPLVRYGIRVRSRTIEIFDRFNASRLYREYEQLYEVPNKKIYEENYYTNDEPFKLDWEYFLGALKLITLPNREEFLRKYTADLKNVCSEYNNCVWQSNVLNSKTEYENRG